MPEQTSTQPTEKAGPPFNIGPLLRQRLIDGLVDEGMPTSEAEAFADELVASARAHGAALRAARKQQDSKPGPPEPSPQRVRELLAGPRPAPFVLDPSVEPIWGETPTDSEDDLFAVLKEHRPNYVTEGVWNPDPAVSTQYTRVKCDGNGCDFYTQDPSWYVALDQHTQHLTEVIRTFVTRSDTGGPDA